MADTGERNPGDGGPRFRRIFMVGHAHLDPVWLWRWTEGYQEARATVHAAVTLLDERPDYVFTLEQMAVLDWIRQSEPQLFRRVRELAEAGRIAIVGGWWVEPDCNLPALEPFIRQGLIGQRFLLEHFGRIATVGFNADPFGHAVTLPQILNGHRIDSYCFLRPGPHETPMPHSLFEWRGLGEGSVLAYRIPHEYCTPGGDLDGHMQQAIAGIAPDSGDQAMIFYGVGNHGGGPTRRNLDSLEALDRAGRHGRLVPAGPGAYFDTVRSRGPAVPVWTGELQRHAAGCYAAHSDIKRLNRHAEAALLVAERLATLAARERRMAYPVQSMDAAWKSLLFNQFHDILPGSAIETAMDDARRDLGAVIATAHKVTNLALQTTARDVDIPLDENTQPVLVFNPHPFDIQAPVEVELAFKAGDWSVIREGGDEVASQSIQPHATMQDGVDFRGEQRRRLVFVADVPALGHQLYRVRSEPVGSGGAAAPLVDLQGHTMSNGLLEAKIDWQTGWLSCLRHLPSGIDFCPPSDRHHTVVSEDGSDTWGHGVVSYVLPGSVFKVESVTVEETGPVRVAIRVTMRWRASRLSTVYSLAAGSDVLDMSVELDWRETAKLLKLRFPTVLDASTARYQMQYGSIERPADGAEYPGQCWVSVRDAGRAGEPSLTVINDAKYAYDCIDGEIGITATRSPVFAWHDPKRLEPGRHYAHHDQGLQRFRCQLLPQVGVDPAPRANALARMLTAPPIVMLESFHPGPLPSRRRLVDGADPAGSITVSAIKPWEDDVEATVIRLVNQADRPAHARLSLPFAGERTLDIDLQGHQIRTFVIPKSPTDEPFEVDLLEFRSEVELPVFAGTTVEER